MADHSKPQVPMVDRPHAPIVYFEGAPTLAHRSGLIAITLSALVETSNVDGVGVHTEEVVTAYLRTNIVGARLLRDTLDKALLISHPAQTGSAN